MLAAADRGSCVAAAPLDRAGPARGSRLGWAFGFCWLASGFWWLFISINQFGGIPAPLALQRCLLAAVLALYYALAAALWRACARSAHASSMRCCLRPAGCWRTGPRRAVHRFPWIAGGYAIRRAAGRLGPMDRRVRHRCTDGLLAASIASAWQQRQRPARAAALLLLPLVISSAGLALLRIHAQARHLNVTLLQSNVAQDVNSSRRTSTRVAVAPGRACTARGTLVVTPESSIPLPLGIVGATRCRAAFAVCARRPRGAGRHLVAATRGLHQLGGRPVGSKRSVTWRVLTTMATPPVAVRRVHPAGLRLVRQGMSIPIGDQERGKSIEPFAVAASAAPADLLRRSVCRGHREQRVGDSAATMLPT